MGTQIIILAPFFGLLALLFSWFLIRKVSRQDSGTERMKEIADFIHEGARAFLMAEYRILVVFVAILFVLIGVGISWLTAYSFLVGAVFSTAAGFIGMNVATKANVRTAAAAKDHGMNAALSVAFSGGAVMGMSVVGFGLVGAGLIYCVTGNPDVLSGFSLGASSIALFARVGVVVQNLMTGNLIVKVLQSCCGTHNCGILIGANIPIAITGRSESPDESYLSLAACAAMNASPIREKYFG